MKKVLFLLTVCALILLSCASTGNNIETPGSETNHEPEAETEMVERERVDVDDPTLEAFLNGEKEFIYSESGKEVNVFTLSEYNASPRKYAVVDLDGDKAVEYLIEYEYTGDTAVLHEKDGVWTAYTLTFRERNPVKTDGSMGWSSGASHNGVQRIEFSDGKMIRVVTLDSDFEGDVHYIDGELVLRKDADKAWNKFDKKENAEWFDIYPAFEF